MYRLGPVASVLSCKLCSGFDSRRDGVLGEGVSLRVSASRDRMEHGQRTGLAAWAAGSEGRTARLHISVSFDLACGDQTAKERKHTLIVSLIGQTNELTVRGYIRGTVRAFPSWDNAATKGPWLGMDAIELRAGGMRLSLLEQSFNIDARIGLVGALLYRGLVKCRYVLAWITCRDSRSRISRRVDAALKISQSH